MPKPHDANEIRSQTTSINDPVTPAHYREYGLYSGLHVAEAWSLGFHLGNTIKYIQRAGKKSYAGMTAEESKLTDLRKARWYLQRYLYLLSPEDEVNPLDAS